MKLKKNPKANLDTYSKLFMQLGLALALFISYVTIEYKTTDIRTINFDTYALKTEIEPEVPQTIRKEKKVKPVLKKIFEKIKIIDNKDKTVDDFIKPEIIDDPVLDPKDIVIADDPTDEVDDIPYILVEDAPIYPGCENLAKPQRKKCFTEHIKKLVNRKFNADLAANLGLTPGKKRIFVMFKIDKTGRVVNIRARAPHKSLEKEAIRVVSLIPKMTPGKQRGRSVGVKYSLPIVFNVQD
jgi:periplasmic protein TonB